jgi:hypothetical protein
MIWAAPGRPSQPVYRRTVKLLDSLLYMCVHSIYIYYRHTKALIQLLLAIPTYYISFSLLVSFSPGNISSTPMHVEISVGYHYNTGAGVKQRETECSTRRAQRKLGASQKEKRACDERMRRQHHPIANIFIYTTTIYTKE